MGWQHWRVQELLAEEDGNHGPSVMAVADGRMMNFMGLPEKLVMRKRCLGRFRKRIFHEEKARVRAPRSRKDRHLRLPWMWLARRDFGAAFSGVWEHR
jgi:hypothetical protein